MAKKEYTKKEAAELLKTTPAAIQKRIERKRIEAFKNDNGQWRVVLDEADLESAKKPKTKVKPKAKPKALPPKATKAKAKPKAAPKKAAPKKAAPKKVAAQKETAAAVSGEAIQTVKPEYIQQYEPECMKEFEKEAATTSPIIPSHLLATVMDFATDVKKKVDETTNFLVEKVEMQRDEAKKIAEKIVEKGESQKNIYMFKLLENIESIRNKIVTRYDIERLESKIEALTRKLKG